MFEERTNRPLAHAHAPIGDRQPIGGRRPCEIVGTVKIAKSVREVVHVSDRFYATAARNGECVHTIAGVLRLMTLHPLSPAEQRKLRCDSRVDSAYTASVVFSAAE